ncbi:MAG: hypothetical protein ABIK65_02235 [Candidatus Eisenbacteria bacterium]
MVAARLFGIWIDERQAVLVGFHGDGPVTLRLIDSGIDEVSPPAGLEPGRSPKAEDPDAEYRRSRAFLRYYRRVIGAVAEADRIAIFGPGEARRSLDREMRRVPGFLSRIVGVEAADAMPRKRFIAKVRAFYHLPAEGAGVSHREPTAA